LLLSLPRNELSPVVAKLLERCAPNPELMIAVANHIITVEDDSSYYLDRKKDDGSPYWRAIPLEDILPTARPQPKGEAGIKGKPL
jgi:hypothetical protein